jgi:hypothetical protein
MLLLLCTFTPHETKTFCLLGWLGCLCYEEPLFLGFWVSELWVTTCEAVVNLSPFVTSAKREGEEREKENI